MSYKCNKLFQVKFIIVIISGQKTFCLKNCCFWDTAKNKFVMMIMVVLLFNCGVNYFYYWCVMKIKYYWQWSMWFAVKVITVPMILKIGFASAMTNLTSTLCTVLEVLHEGGPAPSNLYGSRIFLRKCGPTSLDRQKDNKYCKYDQIHVNN